MRLLFFCISFLLFCGCQREHTPAPTASANVNTNVQRYDVKGVVRELFPERKTVKIDHQKIANYMDAMTMDFEVKNTNELQGLQAGDQVTFRMVVTADDGWIEN